MNRVNVIHALTDIIESDGHTSDFEIAFFNDVGAALQLMPAQLVGLDSQLATKSKSWSEHQ